MLNIITNWRRERSAVSQLSRLSDRELADLGIGRQDIKAVARYASAMTRDDVATVYPGNIRIEAANAVYRPAALAA